MNKKFAGLILFCSLQFATASPMVNYAWREISFTTEGGTHIEAALDEHYCLEKLMVSKHGQTYSVPASELKKMTGADLNNIKVFEEAGYDYVVVRIVTDEFDSETGHIAAEFVWSLRFNNGQLEHIEREQKSGK
jgi:hypothetical protein